MSVWWRKRLQSEVWEMITQVRKKTTLETKQHQGTDMNNEYFIWAQLHYVAWVNGTKCTLEQPGCTRMLCCGLCAHIRCSSSKFRMLCKCLYVYMELLLKLNIKPCNRSSLSDSNGTWVRSNRITSGSALIVSSQICLHFHSPPAAAGY